MTLTALAARDRSGLGGIGRGCGSVISAGSISDAIVGCTVIGVQPRELLILAPRRPSGRGPGASVARGVIVPLGEALQVLGTGRIKSSAKFSGLRGVE